MYWFAAGSIVGFVIGVLFGRKNRQKVEAALVVVSAEKAKLESAIKAKMKG